MTTTSKVLTGLLFSTLLSTSLYASCDVKGYEKKGCDKYSNEYSCEYKKSSKSKMGKIFHKLDLTDKQHEEIKNIMLESKKEMMNKVENILTSEQKEKLKDMKEKRKNHHGKRYSCKG